MTGEHAQRERAARRDKAAHVVTERCPRAPQPRRKQLREINRIAAKQRQLAKAHNRHHPIDLTDLIDLREDPRGAGGGEHKGNRKGGLSAKRVGRSAKGPDAKKSADVLHQ